MSKIDPVAIAALASADAVARIAQAFELSRGPMGPQGDRGFDGKPGDKGDKGDRGFDGKPGAKGDRGDRGPEGARGDDGLPGERGAQGPRGDRGPQGRDGTDGKDGAPGKPGKPGLRWRGYWASRGAYKAGDAVHHLGSSWVAKIDAPRLAPPDRNWDPLAVAGAPGASGGGSGGGLSPADRAKLDGIEDGATRTRALAVEVDFGAQASGGSFLARATVAAPWVDSGTILVATPSCAATPEHSGEDAALEDVSALIDAVVPGVGFDVVARAPSGAFGRYAFNVMGL
jgi:hypothetical protein